MRSASRIAAFGLLLALSACAGCDDRRPAAVPGGAPTTLAQAPARVAVMSPALAQTLRDLGLAGVIVGRHAYDTWSDPDLPVVGDQGGLDYEALVRLRPTHVLLEGSHGGPPDRLLDLARTHGWAVETLPTLTLADVRRSIEALAQRFGDETAKAQARLLTRAFDASVAPRPDLADRAGRCLLLFGIDPPAAAGPGCVHFEILTRWGVTPALTRGGPYVELDREALGRLDPDSVLLIGFPSDARPGLARLLVGSGVRASDSGHFGVVENTLAHLPATSLTTLADDMAGVILGWMAKSEGPSLRQGDGEAPGDLTGSD